MRSSYSDLGSSLVEKRDVEVCAALIHGTRDERRRAHMDAQ